MKKRRINGGREKTPTAVTDRGVEEIENIDLCKRPHNHCRIKSRLLTPPSKSTHCWRGNIQGLSRQHFSRFSRLIRERENRNYFVRNGTVKNRTFGDDTEQTSAGPRGMEQTIASLHNGMEQTVSSLHGVEQMVRGLPRYGANDERPSRYGAGSNVIKSSPYRANHQGSKRYGSLPHAQVVLYAWLLKEKNYPCNHRSE